MKEGFKSLVVATDEGKIMTGIKVRETDTDLLLRDVEDREFAIPLKSIEDQKSGTSLMPVGLVDKLTRSELIDLVRFLSELGKPGPYAAVTARIVRRWETLLPTRESYRLMFPVSEKQILPNDNELSWVPVFSAVAGSLPLNDVLDFSTKASPGTQARKIGFVRCQVNVTTPGNIGFRLNDVNDVYMWIDGKPIEPATNITVPLEVGIHRVTFSVNLLTRAVPLGFQLIDIEGSKAQAQFLGGK